MHNLGLDPAIGKNSVLKDFNRTVAKCGDGTAQSRMSDSASNCLLCLATYTMLVVVTFCSLYPLLLFFP